MTRAPLMHRAWLAVAPEILTDALLLPRGGKVLAATRNPDCLSDPTIWLLVEHEAIPDDAERITAIYETDFDGPRFVRFDVTLRRSDAA